MIPCRVVLSRALANGARSGGIRLSIVAHGFSELGDRADDEMADLDGEMVVVAGRLYFPAGRDDEEMAASDPLPTLTSITEVKRSRS